MGPTQARRSHLFLASWHPRLRDFEPINLGEPESAWPYYEQCRVELAWVGSKILAYALAFGELAVVQYLEKVLVGPKIV